MMPEETLLPLKLKLIDLLIKLIISELRLTISKLKLKDSEPKFPLLKLKPKTTEMILLPSK